MSANLLRHPSAGWGPSRLNGSLRLRMDASLRWHDGWVLMGALLLTACATAPQPISPAELDAYPGAIGMPPDVQRFIVRWTDCQHFLGEPDDDDERRRQIAYAVSQVCPGIDAEARRLRTRHAANVAVIARVRDYEPLGH